MLLSYYVIIVIATLITLPLASKKVVFGYPGAPQPFTSMAAVSKEEKRMYAAAFLLIGIMLVLLCTFREETLPDYMMYQKNYSNGPSANGSRELEPTFVWMVAISPTFLWMLAFYAMLSVSTNLYSIYTNSPNIWLSLLLFIPYYFPLHDMIQIRAAVSCAILLLSIRYISERKWWIFFPLALIAFLFHYSASVMFLLYFVPKKTLNKWIWSAVMLLALAFSFTSFQLGFVAKYIPLEFVQNYLYNYVGNRLFTASAVGPIRILKVILIIVMLFNLDTIKKHYPFAPAVLSIYIGSQLCYLLFADIPVLQGRMGEFLGVSEIFAMAMLPLISKKHYYILILLAIAIAIYNGNEGNILLNTEAVIQRAGN